VVWLGIIGVSGFAGVMIGGCSGFGMGVYWVITRAKVAGHLQECKIFMVDCVISRRVLSRHCEFLKRLITI